MNTRARRDVAGRTGGSGGPRTPASDPASRTDPVGNGAFTPVVDTAGAQATPAAAIDIEARCAQLEDENRRLKLLVADLSLRNEALKLVVAKKW